MTSIPKFIMLSLIAGIGWSACDKIGKDTLPPASELPTTLYVINNSTGIINLGLVVKDTGNTFISLVKNASNGVVTIKDQWLRYEPDWYFQKGLDSFTISVNGANMLIQAIVTDSASADCKIGLLPISAVTRVGVAVTLKAYAYEKFCKGGDDASLRIDQTGRNGFGHTENNNAMIYYTPASTFQGLDQLIYSFAAKDPAEGRAYAEARITVTDNKNCAVTLNDAGVLWKPAPGERSVLIPVPLQKGLCNVQIDTTTLELTAGPLNGKILLYTKQLIQYTPDVLQNQTGYITYQIYDRHYSADYDFVAYEAHFKIAIATDTVGPSCPVILLNDFTTAAAGSKTLVDVFANDNVCSAQNRATLAIVQPPKNGVAAIENGKIAYTPNAGFSGVDTFLYGIKDANNQAYQTGVKIIVQ